MTDYPEISIEDIRKGDLIRKEYDAKYVIDRAHEYVASRDGDNYGGLWDSAYFLLDRPVVLPTEPGVYLDKTGSFWHCDNGNQWFYHGYFKTHATAKSYAPFTRLMTEAEWEAGK